jgi:hypothetical protein
VLACKQWLPGGWLALSWPPAVWQARLCRRRAAGVLMHASALARVNVNASLSLVNASLSSLHSRLHLLERAAVVQVQEEGGKGREGQIRGRFSHFAPHRGRAFRRSPPGWSTPSVAEWRGC